MTIQYIKNLEIKQIKDNWFAIGSADVSSCYLYHNASGNISKLPCTIKELDLSNIAEQLPNVKAEDELDYFTTEKYLAQNKPTRLMIFLTSMCNLRCIYCHCNSTSKGQHMDENFALKVVDRYVNHVQNLTGTTKDTIQITFMGGGEPLLRIRTIQKIVEYLESEGIKGDYVLVTNGTLGTDDDWTWLINKKFRITLSIDGNPQTQNNQRIFADSQVVTWPKLETRLKFISKIGAKIHIRTTVTDIRTIDSTCEYLEQFDCIETHSLEPVSIAGRAVDCIHYPDNLQEFYSQFFKVYSKYLYRNPSRYKSAWFKPFKRMDGFCGAVYHNAVVTHDGYLSLCTEVDSSALETNYGHKFIVSHIDDENPFISHNSLNFSNYHSIKNMEKCQDCAIRYKCGGGCYVKRYRDLTEPEVYYNSFCRNVIKLNLSYLIAMYDRYNNQQ
jgi:radical SAM protein with 4Fe4S-binding SPASM domain